MESVETEDVAAVEPEKSLPVSRVNDLIKREKAAVADKVRQEMEAAYQAELQKLRESKPLATENASNDISDIENRVFNRIMQEAQKQQHADEEEQRKLAMQQVADEYFSKMRKGKEQFDDFDTVMKDFEPASFPQVVVLANEVENTPAVMYELSKNPQKLAAVQLLAERSPGKAREMLAKISESISNNEKAVAEHQSTNAPLSRLKSSNVGADSGKMTIKDYKNAPWLRG